MSPRRRKVLKIVALALAAILVVFAGIAWRVLSRVTGQPHPVPQRAHPDAPEELPADPRTAEHADRIRVHVLVTAETSVPFGQFYGGLEGWVGAAAIWRGGLQRDPMWVPVIVVAIVHPEAGVVLVDTGLSEAQTHPFSHYSVLDGGLNAGIWRDSDNRIAAAGDLVTQLEAIGIAPGDVKHIVLTHLHEDHVGELGRFPSATVHVSALEWNDRARVSYAPSFDPIAMLDAFAYDSGALYSFDASKDLLGDGTVVLLPTPGHTLGHASVLVALGDHHAVVTGDALYTLRHLDPEALASFNYFGEQGLRTYQDSVRRVVALQDTLSELVVIPAHDPFAYGTAVLPRAFADGRLDARERESLGAHRRALFDEAGRLRPAARPRWDEQTERVVVEMP